VAGGISPAPQDPEPRRNKPARAAILQIVRHDPLVRLFCVNLLCGIALAVIAVGGLLLLDVNGLRHLILSDQSPTLALAVLLGGLVLTFGGGLIGTAMLQLDDRP
jgi:hypothetical protein